MANKLPVAPGSCSILPFEAPNLLADCNPDQIGCLVSISQAARMAANAPLVQDHLSEYCLSKDDVEGYLKRKFPAQKYGEIDFQVQVRGRIPLAFYADDYCMDFADRVQLVSDLWNFWAPRRLTEVSLDVKSAGRVSCERGSVVHPRSADGVMRQDERDEEVEDIRIRNRTQR